MAIPFNEEIYNHLSTIMERSVGISLDIRQLDRLRLESDKLAEVITKHVERISQDKALQVCKLLNEATKSGFEAVGAELKEVDGRIDSLLARNPSLGNPTPATFPESPTSASE